MSKAQVFGNITEPTPMDVSNFLYRAHQYIWCRRPYEQATLAILNEKSHDIMDAEIGKHRALEVN
jgi:hypothetical protein